MTLLSKAIPLRKELLRRAVGAAPHTFMGPCLLFDNGSLEPAAALELRRLARELAAATGADVRPVSLLHSSAIDPGRLGGVPARLLEPALRELLQAGGNDILLLPLFFGPSAALTEYLPARLARLRRDFPDRHVRTGRSLVDPLDPADARMAAILADNVRTVVRRMKLRRPAVVLVDHGSPQRAVAAVRDLLGGQLGPLLAGEVERVTVASMERRPGVEYDFCEPTLARLLQGDELTAGDVVLAPQFLLPGRHAGPGGDLASICAAAQRKRPGLRVHFADLVGRHPGVIAVLADRYREIAAPPAAARGLRGRASARSGRSRGRSA